MSLASDFGQELAQGWRRLAAQPWWTAAVVATVALGVAAVTVVYSAAQGILLHPLPYRDAERLALIGLRDAAGDVELDVSWNDFAAVRDGATTLADAEVVAASTFRFNLAGAAHPVQVESALVGWRFFDVLGAPVQHGRPFAEDDQRWGETPNVVISDRLWRQQLAGDLAAVGRTIRLDDRPAMVVGVAAPHLDLPPATDVWVATGPPPAGAPAALRDRRSFRIVGRLAEEASIEQAAAELAAVSRALVEQRPEGDAQLELTLRPILHTIYRGTRPALAAVGIAALLVLLIACANVAALLLVRTRQRKHELAIRSVHGAAPGRLVRQLSTEPLWIAVLATGVGLGLVGACLALWPVIAPPRVPFAGSVTLDVRVIGFAVAVAALAVAACAAAPLLRVLRLQPVSTFRETGGRTASDTHGGGRSACVVFQVAFCLALLAAAVLALNSYQRFASIDPGFGPNRVLSARLSLIEGRHSRADRPALFASLVDGVEALPGVEAAAIVSQRPLASNTGADTAVTVEGQRPSAQEANPPVNLQAASEGYFSTLGIPLFAGRGFDSRDRSRDSQSVIVSRSLAARFWPDRQPIGRRLKLAAAEEDAPWYTVVGVVGDVRHRGWNAPRLDLYVPLSRWNFPSVDLLVRTGGEPLAQVGPVRGVLQRLDPVLALGDVTTLEEVVGDALAGRRFASLLIAALAAVALLLTGVGIAGLLHTWVDGMQRELGVRMALGATRLKLVGLVGGRAGVLFAAGTLIGGVLSAIAYRGARSQLYGLGSIEAMAMLWAFLLLLFAAVVGAAAPLRRIVLTDPVAALNEDWSRARATDDGLLRPAVGWRLQAVGFLQQRVAAASRAAFRQAARWFQVVPSPRKLRTGSGLASPARPTTTPKIAGPR